MEWRPERRTRVPARWRSCSSGTPRSRSTRMGCPHPASRPHLPAEGTAVLHCYIPCRRAVLCSKNRSSIPSSRRIQDYRIYSINKESRQQGNPVLRLTMLRCMSPASDAESRSMFSAAGPIPRVESAPGMRATRDCLLMGEQCLRHGTKLQMVKHIEITFSFFMLQIADEFPETVDTR